MSGKLEIYHDGVWGSVCSVGWNDRDSATACRQLGFNFVPGKNRTKLVVRGTAVTNGTVWMSNVLCSGAENRLQDCDFSGWGSTDCVPDEVVVLQCDADTRKSTSQGQRKIFDSRFCRCSVSRLSHGNTLL